MAFSRRYGQGGGQTTYPIPAGKAGIIIGKGGKTIKELQKTSGARLRVEDDEVVINGTDSQRLRAKELIRKLLEKGKTKPDMGWALLEVVGTSKDGTLRFFEFKGEDINVHSRDRTTYYVKYIPDKDSVDDDDDLVVALSQLSTSTPAPGLRSFDTTEALPHCLGEICSHLFEVDPGNEIGKELRVSLFFGRELFSNMNALSMNVRQWRALNRGQISTSFQHHSPQVFNKIKVLEKKYGFKAAEENKENKGKFSCSIFYEHDDGRRKIKVKWDEDQGKWKVTKAFRNIRRRAILDIINGSDAPDIRFLLKTHHEDDISSRFTKVMTDLQKDNPLTLREGMYLRQSDFEGKIQIQSVRQVTKKTRYQNDVYQLTFTTALHDTDKVVQQESIQLKHLSWKAFHQCIEGSFNETELTNSIQETIKFARELVKVLA